jgi:hypothetical protein
MMSAECFRGSDVDVVVEFFLLMRPLPALSRLRRLMGKYHMESVAQFRNPAELLRAPNEFLEVVGRGRATLSANGGTAYDNHAEYAVEPAREENDGQ